LATAYAYTGLWGTSYLEGELIPSIYAGLRALNLAEAAGASPELARAYVANGLVAGLIPIHFLAEKYNQLAMETAQEVDDLAILAWVLEFTGLYYTGIGRWTEAVNMAEEAAEINDRIGQRRQWDECWGTLAVL
jgi:tetratricopeptide (TPR) repeat protein